MNSANVGSYGERLARQYYLHKGYKILAANFRTRAGEVDLIVQNGQMLVFAEVKTRDHTALARPREWVDAAKQKRIVRAALAYLEKNQLSEPLMRFDVVEIILYEGSRPELRCIENAFTV